MGDLDVGSLFEKDDFRRIEKHYKKYAGPGFYYKVTRNKEKGTHVVADLDIDEGVVLLVEKALHVQPSGLHRGAKKLKDVSEQQLLSQFSEPERAKQLMVRLFELNARANNLLMNSPYLEEIWKLEDSFRQAHVGDEVCIDGISSEREEEKLNGQRGRVIKQESGDLSLLTVSLDDGEIVKSIKRNNLKTLGGICRTNLMESDTTKEEVLFKTVCRINHACGDAANVIRVVNQKKAFVIAKRDIHEGEEILMDYIFEDYDDDNNDDIITNNQRLRRLKDQYNFICTCPLHSKGK